jgi:hypothetical protein
MQPMISHIICFEAAWCGFPHMGITSPQANQHGNISCFSGSLMLILPNQKSHVLKHDPWNLKLETYCPSKHVKFRLAAQHTFQCSGSPSLKRYRPPKHVKFRELCFCPMCPSSMFPHAIPHPCPMTHPWHFRPFSTSHCQHIFFHWTLTSSSPLPHHRFT